MKKIKDVKKWAILTRKISKAQIILDKFKEAVKEGQKNINKLRQERKELEIPPIKIAHKNKIEICECGHDRCEHIPMCCYGTMVNSEFVICKCKKYKRINSQ